MAKNKTIDFESHLLGWGKDKTQWYLKYVLNEEIKIEKFSSKTDLKKGAKKIGMDLDNTYENKK